MPIKSNGYYNNPAFAQAASNLAGIFAAPEGADAAGWATAKAKREEAGRLAEAFRIMTDPKADRSVVDRYGVAAGHFAPTGSYYSVDQSNATSRANNAATIAGSERMNAADNDRALQQTLLAPLGTGQTRMVPPSLAERFQIDENQTGVLELDQGKTYLVPGEQRAIEGPSKPMTLEEAKGQQFGQMAPALREAITFGSTPVESIVTEQGTRLATRPDALGQEPAPDAAKAVKPTNGVAMLPDGAQVPAIGITRRPGRNSPRTSRSSTCRSRKAPLRMSG
jgi:hypothetical protein